MPPGCEIQQPSRSGEITGILKTMEVDLSVSRAAVKREHLHGSPFVGIEVRVSPACPTPASQTEMDNYMEIVRNTNLQYGSNEE